MRFDQQKSACSRLIFVGTLVGTLSASGSGVFAFGQGQGPQAPAPPVAAQNAQFSVASPNTAGDPSATHIGGSRAVAASSRNR